MACPSGAEKVIHGLRSCIEKHWTDEDFTVLKIDTFNLVSCQVLLNECATCTHFPELLLWAVIMGLYSQHPLLRHHLGTMSSEVGVQQGDPLSSLFFYLVLLISCVCHCY